MTAPYPYPPHQQAPHQQAPHQQAPHQQAPRQHVPQPHHYPPAPWQPASRQMPYGQAPWPYPPVAVAPRPWYGQPWAIALLVVTVLTVLGGAVLVGGSRGTTTTGAGTGGPVGGKGTSCPGGSMEGCYSQRQMQVFLNQAVTVVHRFSDASYPGMPHPAGYRLIDAGDTVGTRCGTLDATAYAYCPADDNVYIGQSQLWSFYSELGDAAAVVGLAHEYGHHIQTVAGVPNVRTSRGQIAHENQADCIAGAFVGFAQQQGMLEDDDVQDISGLLSAIASSEDDPGRDHGTLEERKGSLALGIRDGLRGCNSFFPDTPVQPGS